MRLVGLAVLMLPVGTAAMDGPASWDEASALWRTRSWSAEVELRSSGDGERFGVPRRMGVTWDPEGRVVTLRASGLRVWATDGRLVIWNPLHAGVVFEVVEDGAAVGGLIARSLPALLLPPLAEAVSNGEVVVGEQMGLVWEAGDPARGAGEASGVEVVADLAEGSPWVSRIEVNAGSSGVHRLAFATGGSAVGLPADLGERRRVEGLGDLAGRVGDVGVGERLPMVTLGIVGASGDDRAAWPLGAVFGAPGRGVSAMVVFVGPPNEGDAGLAAEIVGELRRTLARRSVAAGRAVERFPGVIARPAFVLEPSMYDASVLEHAGEAWAELPRQPGFEDAESLTPNALWGPAAELRDRIAPEADRVIAVVGASGRLVALVPFEGAGSAEATAVALADAIAPDLIPVMP